MCYYVEHLSEPPHADAVASGYEDSRALVCPEER